MHIPHSDLVIFPNGACYANCPAWIGIGPKVLIIQNLHKVSIIRGALNLVF